MGEGWHHMLTILKGEQKHLESGSKAKSDALIDQLTEWAYNLEPFQSHSWDSSMKPLAY